MEVRLELRKQRYGAGWYKALCQVLSVTGDYTLFVVGLWRSNARLLRGGIQGSRRFSSGTISEHIAVKDDYAVLALLHSILRDTTPRNIRIQRGGRRRQHDDVPRVQTRKGSERATSRVDHQIVMVAGERRFHGEFAVDAIGRLQRSQTVCPGPTRKITYG